MDNEMIARVMKASFDCWNEHRGLNYVVADLSDSEKEFAKVHAVAIIKAMREPTEKMKAIVTADMVITDKCYYCGGHIDGWRTMIDSITND